MAAYDHVRHKLTLTPHVVTRNVNSITWLPGSFQWPAEATPSSAERNLAKVSTFRELTPRDLPVTPKRANIEEALARRIESLKPAAGKCIGYGQFHVDILFLELLLNQHSARASPDTASGLSDGERVVRSLEESIRNHLRAKFCLVDGNDSRVTSYSPRGNIPNATRIVRGDYYYRLPMLPSLETDSTQDSQREQADKRTREASAADLERTAHESSETELRLQEQIKDLKRQLQQSTQHNALVNLTEKNRMEVVNNRYVKALEENSRLTRQVDDLEKQLAATLKEKQTLTQRVATLERESAKALEASQVNSRRQYSTAAPSASLRSAPAGANARSEALSKPPGNAPDIQRLLTRFTSLLKENRLIRGDEFCRRLRQSGSCPPTWQLSTWSSRLTSRENGEEWQIMLAEPTPKPGQPREAHVFVASHCPISDQLIGLFDGCTGHGFDARVASTLRPARIHLAAGNTFTVCLPKGEVSVS